MKSLLLSIISLIIIDSNTQEPLTGVEVKNMQTNQSYYTDLDGKVELCDDEDCQYKITYISYSDTIISDVKDDTIIKLK